MLALRPPNYFIDNIKAHFDERRYKFFDGNKPFNLNIIGVRGTSVASGRFDDYICMIYRTDKLEWVLDLCEATTDPGKIYLKNPINRKGCAVLAPGQYRGAYKIGMHRNKYKALVQSNGPVKVYRDNNRDDVINYGEAEYTGHFGINIHRRHPGLKDDFVKGSSAGCQVFRYSNEFKHLMNLATVSADIYGNSFTYTLLEIKDFL